MPKKKIILGMIALGLCTACITQATWYNIAVGETKNLGQNIESTPDNAGNFGGYDTINELSKNVFYLADRSSNDFNNTKMAFYYWIDEGLAYYRPGSYKIGGLVTKFYITNYNGYSNITQPNAPNLSTGTYEDIANLGITYGDITDIAYNDQWLKYQRGYPLCFRGQNKDFSICAFCNEGNGACGLEQTGNFIDPTQTQIALFSSIPDEYLKNSIWNGGGEETGRYTKLPMCYTIQQKIDTFPSNYNTGMCYSTNKIWSGNQFITVTPKSMLELRPTYQEYENDVNLYQNYCGNYVANNTACGEAFSGKEDKRSIINKLYNQGTQTILRSYDYCYLQLNFTEEQKNTRTNCTMNPDIQHGSGITTDEIIEDMQNHRITIIAPDGTTVYSGFWNNGSGENQDANLSYEGIIETMQSVRGKLTNIFYYRSGVTGIIPDYITRILLLIVLFAIFKK